MAKRNIISVDVELTDRQILEAAAEIYQENPTAFLGEIVSIATQSGLGDLDMANSLG